MTRLNYDPLCWVEALVYLWTRTGGVCGIHGYSGSPSWFVSGIHGYSGSPSWFVSGIHGYSGLHLGLSLVSMDTLVSILLSAWSSRRRLQGRGGKHRFLWESGLFASAILLSILSVIQWQINTGSVLQGALQGIHLVTLHPLCYVLFI